MQSSSIQNVLSMKKKKWDENYNVKYEMKFNFSINKNYINRFLIT